MGKYEEICGAYDFRSYATILVIPLIETLVPGESFSMLYDFQSLWNL